MAVFREGYKAVELIQSLSGQVFIDACDYGAPVTKGDAVWDEIKQLMAYADKGDIVRGEDGVEGTVTLIDEWAVSDRRKTVEQATDIFKVVYTKLEYWKGKPYLMPNFRQADGFVNVYKLNKHE